MMSKMLWDTHESPWKLLKAAATLRETERAQRSCSVNASRAELLAFASSLSVSVSSSFPPAPLSSPLSPFVTSTLQIPLLPRFRKTSHILHRPRKTAAHVPFSVWAQRQRFSPLCTVETK